MTIKNFFFYALLSFSLFKALTAQATLGEQNNGITKFNQQTSQKFLLKTSTSNANYSTHSYSNGATVIKEYVGANNVVFAVSWKGLVHPDLSKLLGSYWTEYSQKVKTTNPSRRVSQVQTSKITVQKSGHMRKVSGKAYITSLLPSGVTANEIN
jgi:hypothetical protein